MGGVETMTDLIRKMGLDTLSERERIELAIALLDSAHHLVEAAPISEAQRVELERRLAAHLANPHDVVPWEQAKSAALQKEIDDLNGKVVSMTKKGDEEKAASEKSIASLNDRLSSYEKRLKQFADALEQWKLAQQQAAGTAQQKEAARVDLANQVLFLKNTVADRERKNLNLYKTSLEILERYENYALGKALSAREPFIQKTRVTVENQVQGYKDAIIDNRISAQPK